MEGQGTKCRRKIAEMCNRLSRVHELYRRQRERETTDGQAIAVHRLVAKSEKRPRNHFRGDGMLAAGIHVGWLI